MTATSPMLLFTRDGKRIVVHGGDGVRLVDTAGAPAVTLAERSARDARIVGDEIWIVDDAPALHRFDARGGVLGAPRPLWGMPGDGRLVPVASGGGALWTASPPAIVRASDPELVRVPGDADLVVPISAIRWITCSRQQIAVCEPAAERWRASLIAERQRALDAAVMFDNRAAAVITGDDRTGTQRQLVVVSLHAPVVQHRLTLVGVDAVKLATLRGFAMLVAGNRLTLVDLRFARVIGEYVATRPLAAVAIDPSARTVALLWGDDGDLVLVATSELFVARVQASIAATAEDPSAASAEEAVPAEASAEIPVPATEAFHRGPSLASCAALLPRPVVELPDPARVERWLEARLALITAQAGRAIAVAWNEGRLSFPTDGGLPFKTEVAALLGRDASLASQEVARTRAEVAAARAKLQAIETESAALPLRVLADEFGLSQLAQTMLIAIAAPALHGEMARLYGILANDDDRGLVDELLLCHLLAGEALRSEIARELDPDAPLVRHGLLEVARTMRPFAALTVEPIVLRRLRAHDLTEALDAIRIFMPSCSFEEFLTPAATKAEIAAAMAVAPVGGRPRIVIRGRVGSGRHTLLAILARAAGRELAVIDATPVIRELKARGPQLEAALRRAHVLGMLPCIDGLEHIASDDQITRETVRELLRAHPGPLAIRLPWDAEPTLDPGHVAIDLPALAGDPRVVAWNAALARHGIHVPDVAELADRYSVGVGIMMRAAEQVAAARPTGDAAPALENAIRQHLVTRLRSTAGRVSRLATWSQIILPTDVQASILELIARIKHHGTVYSRWGFDRMTTTASGVTALFQGGPGTGKTLVATAIANELGMDLYRVDLSRIMSKWIGETEQNLAKLFDAAEDGHAIILFDEADSLFSKRTEVRTSVDRYANLEVNFLLQRLDTFEGVAILTTNFGTAIDSAFKRRLSFRLTFPFPDEEMRERLWRVHLPPQLPRAGDFDLGDLARRFRLSGGYIRNAVLRAAFLAAEEHVPMNQDHLQHAIRAEFSEIGKLSESGMLE